MSYKEKLSERRAALAIEARRLLDAHKGSDFGKEQLAAYDGLTAEICDIDARLAAEQARLDKLAEDTYSLDSPSANARPSQASASLEVFNTWARKFGKDLTAEERTAIRNTMSTTTGSQGGYTVASELGAQIIAKLKHFGAMRNVAQVVSTAQGNPMAYPTTDGTSETGEWLAENASATSLDPSFGTVDIAAFKAGSKVITVPIELLEDSSFDIAGFIVNRMSERLGRTVNTGYTTGTGTGQPFGVVTQAAAGKVGGTGQTTTFTYNDLVDLYESIDQAYIEGGNCQFMFSQDVRKALRKMVDSANRPIWTPGYEYGSTAGIPDQLLGANVVINNGMPTPAANAKSILFGDFRRYVIRDVNQVVMFRFEDSAFTTKGQVGFMSWVRTGGNLTDTSAVKYYQHSAT